MPYQIYNRPIVDPGAIAAGQQFAAPFGRAREVADANQRRREDIARASGQRSEDIQRALDTQGFNVMQATLERAKVKLSPVQQPVLGADGKTTMQTVYQQAPRDPAEVSQIMTQQFGAGWEARMQAISQKLGMYGEGQPAPVTAPPGTPPGTTPREQPTPPITGANTTQGDNGWPQSDWTTPATSIASAIDLARAAPGQLKAAVQERMTQPWSELGRRVETNAAPLLETITRGRGGEPGPTGGTMGPTAVRSIYNKFATPPQGERSIWEMEGTPYKKRYPSVNPETLKRYRAAMQIRNLGR